MENVNPLFVDTTDTFANGKPIAASKIRSDGQPVFILDYEYSLERDRETRLNALQAIAKKLSIPAYFILFAHPYSFSPNELIKGNRQVIDKPTNKTFTPLEKNILDKAVRIICCWGSTGMGFWRPAELFTENNLMQKLYAFLWADAFHPFTIEQQIGAKNARYHNVASRPNTKPILYPLLRATDQKRSYI